MRSIETVATVTADGTLTAQIPTDISPGQHRVIMVLDDVLVPPRSAAPKPALELHASPWTGWPPDATFRREDIYGDDGR